MSYPINYPTPQKSNFQAFYGGGTAQDWVKPQGASMVRMLLIGAGAGGRNGTTSAGGQGGGSGAVTQWIGPAIFIPDVLRISVGAGGAAASAGGSTTVIYQAKDGTGYTLLTANGAASGSAGGATSNNFFGAAGIFKSIAGQPGANSGNARSASTTTFLQGGSGGAATNPGGSGGQVVGQYGYPNIAGGDGTGDSPGKPGYFLLQPIMVGAGGSGGGSGNNGGVGGDGGIGCGGGGGGMANSVGGTGGRGGDGAVFIWSW